MAKKKEKNNFGGYVKWFWILIIGGILSVSLFITLTAYGLFGALPTFEEIENPKSNLASQIITADGKILGKFYKENRTHTDFHELAPILVNTLVATEDERYYDHCGIDFEALVRAVAKLGKDGGGSTITQQLAKQLFHEPARSLPERIIQKIQEWIISVRLERKYTKQEVIAMYFNQFDFLYQAVGIHSAAKIYFATTPDSLTIDQAAILVGMAKNPSYYNPKRDSLRMVGRRNTVYGQLLRNELINQETKDSLGKLGLAYSFNRESHLDGSAPYFREYLRAYLKTWVKENPKPDGSEYNIYTDGLKIYSTLDSRMQAYAESAVKKHFKNLQRTFFKQEKKRKQAPFHNLDEDQIDRLLTQAKKRTQRYRGLKKKGLSRSEIDEVFETPIPMTVFSWNGDIDTVLSPLDSIRYYKHFYNCGLISVEPQTGFVKAWVGGINYKHFKYDHVKQGKRQVGSTFKPFVYATAIKQKHYSPCFQVPNVITCIEKGKFGLLDDWCPKNSDGKYGGVYTLKHALANSVNTVTTYLMRQVGPEPVARLANEMGIKSEIDLQPSIALGTVDLSVYEMAGSYTTFANKGVYTEPIMITRIEDKNGVILQEFSPLTNEVMSEEDAYIVLDLLKGVTQTGTGARLRSTWTSTPKEVVTGFPYEFTNPIAGKTGTTQNNSDGWFMGLVPNLITAVWGGCEDRAAHFGSVVFGQGATIALPVWGQYMKSCYNDKNLNISLEDFEKPLEEISMELNCNIFQNEKDSSQTQFNAPNNEFD